jgi:hypothetical protein
MIDSLSKTVLEVFDTFGVPSRLVDFQCCDGTTPAYRTPYGFNPLEITIFTAVPVRAVNAVLAALFELQPDFEIVVCASSPVQASPVTRKPFMPHQTPLSA